MTRLLYVLIVAHGPMSVLLSTKSYPTCSQEVDHKGVLAVDFTLHIFIMLYMSGIQ